MAEFELPTGSPRKIVVTIVYALALAVLGHAVWEIAVRPGVSVAEERVRAVFTLGSHAIRDAPYASAALDPTPLPSLMWFLLLAYSPTFLLGMVVGAAGGPTSWFRRWLESRVKVAGGTDSIAALKTKRAVLSRWLLALRIILITQLVVVAIVAAVAASVVNEAVAVWRAFHSNVEMIGPYLSEQERRETIASFASMTSRSDYDAINNRLATIAKAHAVRLHEVRKR